MEKHESARALHDPRMASSYFPLLDLLSMKPRIHLHVWENIEQFYI